VGPAPGDEEDAADQRNVADAIVCKAEQPTIAFAAK